MSETELERALMEAQWPGARRRGYLFVTWILPLLVGGVVMLSASLFLVDGTVPGFVGATIALVYLGMIIVIVFFALQRLVNLGMSRWWFLGNFVPLLNLWVAYRSICCPAGYEYHRKLDGIGVLLAVLYWGSIALMIISMALVFMAAAGMASGLLGDDWPARMQEMLEKAMEDLDVPAQDS